MTEEPPAPPPGRTVAPAPPPGRTVVRCRRDAVILVVAAVVLLLSSIPVEEHHLSDPERSTFRAVNDAPSLPFAPVWVVMQLGNVAVIAVAALAALAWRRPRLALGLLSGGVLAYVGAKVVKQFVTRGRPPRLLSDVVIRGDPSLGLGFVSGHAAVVTVLAFVAAPWLSRRGRWIVAGVVVVVCLSRVYVGAHLPLDVVGGAALGVAVGAAIRLIFGRPPATSG